MNKFKTLKCYNCSSVIANLPEPEVFKLNGLTFRCECCNHKNVLKDSKFEECVNDKYLNFLTVSEAV